MKVVVSENSETTRTLEVHVDRARVEGAYQKAFGRAARNLALPGFRKGKVPPHLARKYITDDGLASHVLEDLVPNAYREALVQEDLRPISEPKMELVQRERGKDLIFKVSFEVRPVIELTDYKGIALKHERADITDEMVTAALEDIRAQHGKIVPLKEERGVVEGDLALVNYFSRIGDEPVKDGSAQNYLMELKKENFIPGFLDHLTGLKNGEEKEFDIEFPADYPNPDLAGREIHFEFKLIELRCRELPDLDDEFAQAISPHKTMADLRTDIRARMEANLERRIREQVAVKMIDGLLAQIPSEKVPQSLHGYRTQVELRRRMSELSQAGITIERYLADRNIEQEKWLLELSVMGMLESRVELLVESLARAEGIKVTEDELQQLMEVEARNRGITLNQLRRQVDDNTMDMVRYNLLRAKVMDFLYDNGKIEFVPPGTLTEEDQAPAAEAKAKPKSKARPKAAKAEAPETAKAEAPEADKAEAPEAETEKPAKPKVKAAKAEKPPAKAEKAAAAEKPAAQDAAAKPRKTKKKAE